MTEMIFTHLRNLQTELIGGNLPFVSWRLPGMSAPETVGSSTLPEQITDIRNLNDMGPGFVMAPFQATHPALFIPKHWYRSGFRFDGLPLKFERQKQTSLQRKIELTNNKREYIRKVESAVQRIKQGGFDKVVLSRIISVPLHHEFDVALFFGQLCCSYPQAFVYLCYLPGKGIWAGATPELLLSIEGEEVTTMALAGTRKAGITGNWPGKEQEEHRWVSHYIAGVFTTTGAIGIQQSEAYTVNAGPVDHLRTDFSAHLPDMYFGSLIKKLHPTPAVCGWPQERALETIADLEDHDREFYTGFAGPVNGKNRNSELYVNLRCVRIADSHADIYVGGGITVDSDPEAEWEETTLKSQTLLEVIKKC